MSRCCLVRRSFTLIEVVTAMFLMTGVLGIVFLGTHSVMRTWQQIEGHSRHLDELLTLDRTVDGMFANTFPFTWPDEDGRDRLVFAGEPEAVQFAYFHRFNRLEDGAIRFCRIVREGNTLAAYYCERPPFPAEQNAPRLQRSILARHVAAASFSYALMQDGELTFTSAWDLEEQTEVPLAIQLHVTWEDGTEHSWLRRTAGAGRYERWASRAPTRLFGPDGRPINVRPSRRR